MSIDITKLTLEELLELKAQLAYVNIRRTNTQAHPATEWDWTKTNGELAIEHGYTYSTISQYRKIYGNGRKATKYSSLENENIDWSKSDTTIARENKVPICCIKRLREKLGKPKSEIEDRVLRPYVRLPSTEWEKLDWTKIDIVLARENGVTRERIRQIRAQLGKPRIIPGEAEYHRFLDCVNGTEPLSLEVARNKYGEISRRRCAEYCARAGITFENPDKKRKSIYPWDKLDFRLPNLVLSEIWRIHYQAIANRRSQSGFRKPAFRSVNGLVPPEFAGLVEAEKQKAAEHFATKDKP